MFLTSSRTSNLNVPDLQRHRASLRADDVILSSLSHLTLQRLKLTVNVWKPISSRSTTLHLKPPEDTEFFSQYQQTHQKKTGLAAPPGSYSVVGQGYGVTEAADAQTSVKGQAALFTG